MIDARTRYVVVAASCLALAVGYFLALGGWSKAGFVLGAAGVAGGGVASFLRTSSADEATEFLGRRLFVGGIGLTLMALATYFAYDATTGGRLRFCPRGAKDFACFWATDEGLWTVPSELILVGSFVMGAVGLTCFAVALSDSLLAHDV
jgi:hypothetical protein